jgi:CTP-dependent riboflavin kinase
MTYRGQMVDGTGRASRMHPHRGPAVEAFVGRRLYPGTLNVDLDRPFDWSGADRLEVPTWAERDNLEGPWEPVGASVRFVRLNGVEAWALRLDTSNAPAHRVELWAPFRLRSLVDEPMELVVAR